jgi:hypothetical protein
MNNTKDFLTSGPVDIGPPVMPLLGIKFISINASIEFIGEVFRIVDSVAFIKDPILLSRDQKNVSRFNFIVFHNANPIVTNEIQVPLSAIAFMCTPSERFIKNYIAARSGLVTAATFYDSNDAVNLKR